MTEHDIKQHLRTKTFGRHIYCFDSIDSTNTYAKKLVSQDIEEGTLVIAEEQTAGRGRFDRTWHSSSGKNLTFSVIIRPNIIPQRIGILSLYAGLAVTEAVQELSNIPPACKWPNDVLVNGKKLCGILSEAVFSGTQISAVIIGIGLNVNQTEFPNALESTATSMTLECSKIFDRFHVLANVLEKLEHLYTFIQTNQLEEILQRWQSHTIMFGKEVTIKQHGQRVNGIAQAIDLNGALIISTNGTENKVVAGDVTILQ